MKFVEAPSNFKQEVMHGGVGKGSRQSNARTHTHPQSSAYCKYYSVLPYRQTTKLNKSLFISFLSLSEKIFFHFHAQREQETQMSIPLS